MNNQHREGKGTSIHYSMYHANACTYMYIVHVYIYIYMYIRCIISVSVCSMTVEAHHTMCISYIQDRKEYKKFLNDMNTGDFTPVSYCIRGSLCRDR